MKHFVAVRLTASVLGVVLIFSTVPTAEAATAQISASFDQLDSADQAELMKSHRAEVVAESDPSAFYEWQQGSIRLKPDETKLPAGLDRETLELIVHSLNHGLQDGHLEVTPEFVVTVTEAGEAYWRQTIEEWSRGCLVAVSVTADWLGVTIPTRAAECGDSTAASMDLRSVSVNGPSVADPAQAGLATASSSSLWAEPIGHDQHRARQASVAPLAMTGFQRSGIHMNHSGGSPAASCGIAATSYVASTISLFLLIAFPPSGVLAWVGTFTLAGYGYVTASYDLSQACNGAHGAKSGSTGNPCGWSRQNYQNGYYRQFKVLCKLP